MGLAFLVTTTALVLAVVDSAVAKDCDSVLNSPNAKAEDILECAAAPASAPALYRALGFIFSREAVHPSPADVVAADAIVASLETLGAKRPSDVGLLYSIYLDNNDWDRATAIADPERPPPQRMKPPVRPSANAAEYWQLAPDGRFHGRTVNLSKGSHILVVSSPSCHFSSDAAKWINSAGGLRSRFSQAAIWIDRPDSGFGARQYKDWNDKHPATPMSAVTDITGWPMPDVWATPQFYFIKDGSVVRHVFGWTEESKRKVLGGLDAIGLR